MIRKRAIIVPKICRSAYNLVLQAGSSMVSCFFHLDTHHDGRNHHERMSARAASSCQTGRSLEERKGLWTVGQQKWASNRLIAYTFLFFVRLCRIASAKNIKAPRSNIRGKSKFGTATILKTRFREKNTSPVKTSR